MLHLWKTRILSKVKQHRDRKKSKMSSSQSPPGSPQSSQMSRDSLFLSGKYMNPPGNGESQYQSRAQNEPVFDLSKPFHPQFQSQPQPSDRNEPPFDLSEPFNPQSQHQPQPRDQNKPAFDLSEPFDPHSQPQPRRHRVDLSEPWNSLGPTDSGTVCFGIRYPTSSSESQSRGEREPRDLRAL